MYLFGSELICNSDLMISLHITGNNSVVCYILNAFSDKNILYVPHVHTEGLNYL